MKKTDFGPTDIRLPAELTLQVEWNYYAEQRSL